MSCPADLEPYAKAYELEQKHKDAMAWSVCGSYLLSAVGVAVEHCLAGRNARSEYIDKPLFRNYEQNNEYGESQEEIAVFEMKQRIKLITKNGMNKSPI